MQLEDYFEFVPPPHEQIRIKGTRIGIEHVVRRHLAHLIPEQIAVDFVAPLTVEQVYATVAYYLHNKDQVDEYIRRIDEEGDRLHQEYLASEPSALLKKLREAKAAKASAS
jgi:uncharacterized protein (DUF433 family)